MNYGCISHVFYAFAHVAADGGIFVSAQKTPPLHRLRKRVERQLGRREHAS